MTNFYGPADRFSNTENSRNDAYGLYLYGIDPITEDFFHSSNLKGFPTRIHIGQTPTHYGLAVNLEDQQALSRFVEWLVRPDDAGGISLG